jgi:hypothetical protein
VRNVAAGYGIELLFIPLGMADRLGPLNQHIFRALKSSCRSLFDAYCTDDTAAYVDTSRAVQFQMEAWEKISLDGLGRAGRVYAEEDQSADEEWDDVRSETTRSRFTVMVY